MTDEAMSPLRRRMIEDMTIRKSAPKTQQGYVPHDQELCCVSGPLARHGELRGRTALSAISCCERSRHAHSQSHCVGTAVLFSSHDKRYAIVERTTFIHEPPKLPVVLGPEEVARMAQCGAGLKYKAALSAAHGVGLRAAEVVSLTVSDVDSKRMVIRVDFPGRDPAQPMTTRACMSRSPPGRDQDTSEWHSIEHFPIGCCCQFAASSQIHGM